MNNLKNKFYTKAIQLICVAFVVLSLTSTLLANESGSTLQRKLKAHSIGLGLGQVFLYGDHADHGDSALGIDLMYAYTVSYSFDLLIDTHFSSHSSDQTKTTLWGTSVNIKGRFFDFDSFAPYFLGGLGFYAPKNTRVVNGVLSKSSGKLGFGFSFGTGVDLRLNEKISLGIMAVFHKPFDISQGTAPEVSGSYLRLLLSLFYTF